MSIGITIATVMFCFYLYQYIEEKKQAKEEKENRFFEELKNSDNQNEIVADEPPCLDERTITGLVLCTLRKIGCNPEMEERAGVTWVYFTYQGEKFTIECRDDCQFIVIYDTWWFHISVYSDVEDIANLHKVINLTNQHANVTVIHTVNDEMEEIGVHSRKNILFIPQIPHIDKYLVSTLDDFFVVQRHVVREFEKCKVREEQETNR